MNTHGSGVHFPKHVCLPAYRPLLIRTSPDREDITFLVYYCTIAEQFCYPIREHNEIRTEAHLRFIQCYSDKNRGMCLLMKLKWVARSELAIVQSFERSGARSYSNLIIMKDVDNTLYII